jgi:light-regulated signal transduction histidine kinase (bacteriophytochrome)
MVSLSLDIMRRKYGHEIGVQANEYLSTAVDGAGRMRQLINDLLTYSRVETQSREFNAVDMNGVVAAVLRDLEVAIDESAANIEVGALPTVLADEVQMKQLLSNLVGNAVKYRSVARPEIEVACAEIGKEYVFSVSDNGIGIDPKYIPSLFRMFYRLHSRDEYSGTGIGLAICKKIVERHGGRIWVESDGENGATFYFTVPSLNAPVSRLMS